MSNEKDAKIEKAPSWAERFPLDAFRIEATRMIECLLTLHSGQGGIISDEEFIKKVYSIVWGEKRMDALMKEERIKAKERREREEEGIPLLPDEAEEKEKAALEAPPSLTLEGKEENPLDAYYRTIEAASALLPAWFIPRMMDDTWSFGLLLVTGKTLAISRIEAVRQDKNGDIWLDVEMQEKAAISEKDIICSPTTRLTASVQAKHIIAAFELADT